MRLFSTLVLSCSLLISACDNSTSTTEPSKKATEGSFKKLDLETIEKAADDVVLVPPPLELQQEFKKAGLKTDLATLIAPKALSMDIDDKDQIALRSGVLISDLVFTIKSAEPKELIEKLNNLKLAFKKLKAGNDISATIDDLVEKLSAENPDRDALLEEINDLSMVMVAEFKYEVGDWVVPLIQAGTWLEGSYLVSTAIIKENNTEAIALLKKPGTAAYFLRYVKREGQSKAPPIVITKLAESLETLEQISRKKELTMDDVKKVNSLTSELMRLL